MIGDVAAGGPFQFASIARLLAQEARRLGLVAPSFRTPPRADALDRTVRGVGTPSPVVAVRLQGRPFVAVVADLVDGVVAVNGLRGVDASRVRAALWTAAAEYGGDEPGWRNWQSRAA